MDVVEKWFCKDRFFNFVCDDVRFWNLLRLMFACIFMSLEGEELQNLRSLFCYFGMVVARFLDCDHLVRF